MLRWTTATSAGMRGGDMIMRRKAIMVKYCDTVWLSFLRGGHKF
jgi:hypothetical protein